MRGLEARLRKLEMAPGNGNALSCAFRRNNETEGEAIERTRSLMATEPRRWVVMSEADDRL